ncbi:tetratricopeptide repeat protein [Pendulispora albinea]|uniref:Tetratricopeptide repeat protein n=1 Tax=Pendulispora albinea TaxID=2741071 RepID=A0ABZ2M3T0_9BACT
MKRTAMAAVTFWLASVAAGGCGGTLARRPFTCPEKGGAAWSEVKSTHFTLRTDLEPEVARHVSAELETRFSALADLGFEPPLDVRTRLDIVYFRHREEYEKVAPKATAGVFGREGGDFERGHIAILQGDFTQRAKELVQHELTHFFVHAYYPQAPIWLNEGLADYYESLDLDGEMAVLGRAPRSSRFWKGPWSAKLVDGEYTWMIPMSEAPTARALLSMDAVAFEGASNRDVSTPEGLKAVQQMSAHYAGAWTLVHLLMAHPDYRTPFEDYRQRLLKGESSEQAWAETLGKVPEGKLEKDYTDALVPSEVITYRTKYTPARRAAEATRTLSDADVHMLWARLRDWRTPDGLAAARSDMNEARAHEPHHPELAILTAYMENDRGNVAAAEATLKAALAERPNDPRLLNAMGWIELNAIGQKTRPPAALTPVAEKLEPLAKTAAELDLLGWTHLLVHDDVDRALAYEKRAIAADPSCYPCFSAASIMLDQKGRLREALQTATLALHLLPDGASAPALVGRIESYRRRLSEKGDAASRSSPPKP